MVGGKIFGCGLYRTGTSSLHVALLQLGYRSVHHQQYMRMVEIMNRDAGRPLLWGVEHKYDTFFDGNLMYAFKELDRQYPGNKFICTQRDEDSWVRSVLKRRDDDLLRRIPMLADRDEEFWREHYSTHYAAVANYFRGRDADVLHLNVTAGQGWPELCGFLGLETPAGPFPHENAADAAVSPFWAPLA